MSTTIASLLVKITADTKGADSDIRRLDTSLGSAAKTGAGFAAGMLAVEGALRASRGVWDASVGSAISWESAMAGVRKTVTGTPQEIGAIGSALRDMSKEIPTSATNLAKIAESAGQLGIKKANIVEFTRVVADLGETTNLAGEQGATGLARLANITQMSQENFDNLASTVVALGNAGASTEAEILDMGLRIAGAGHQVGLTEAQVLGFANALSSVGIEAESGGTAISRVFVEIDKAVADGGAQLEEFARVSGMSAAEYKAAWGADAAGATIAFIEGLSRVKGEGENVFRVLEGLELGEIRVRDALLRASGAGDLFRESLKLGNEAWRENTALTEEASKRYETTAAKIDIAKNSIVDAGRSVGEGFVPAIAKGAEGVTFFAEAMAAVPPSTTALTASTVALAVALPGAISLTKTLVSSMDGGIPTATKFALGIGAITVAADGLLSLTTGHGLMETLFGNPAQADAAASALARFTEQLRVAGPEVDRVAFAQDRLNQIVVETGGGFHEARMGIAGFSIDVPQAIDNIARLGNQLTGVNESAFDTIEASNELKEEIRLLAWEMVEGGASATQLRETYNSLPGPLREVFDDVTRVTGAVREQQLAMETAANVTDGWAGRIADAAGKAAAAMWAMSGATLQLQGPHLGKGPIEIAILNEQAQERIDALARGAGGGGAAAAAKSAAEEFAAAWAAEARSGSLAEAFGETGGSLMDAFAASMESPGSAARIPDIITRLVDEARELGVPNAKELGENLAAAIAAGLETGASGEVESALTALTEKAKEAGKLTVESFGTALASRAADRRLIDQIGSGGKSMMDALGKAIEEGGRTNIDKLADQVDSMVDKLADKAPEAQAAYLGTSLTEALTRAIESGGADAQSTLAATLANINTIMQGGAIDIRTGTVIAADAIRDLAKAFGTDGKTLVENIQVIVDSGLTGWLGMLDKIPESARTAITELLNVLERGVFDADNLAKRLAALTPGGGSGSGGSGAPGGDSSVPGASSAQVFPGETIAELVARVTGVDVFGGEGSVFDQNGRLMGASDIVSAVLSGKFVSDFLYDKYTTGPNPTAASDYTGYEVDAKGSPVFRPYVSPTQQSFDLYKAGQLPYDVYAKLVGLENPDGSHEMGLPYVPYDGYLAQLHKGERVVPARENRGYGTPIIIQAIDAQSVENWLRNGGAEQIWRAVRSEAGREW
ncbi:MAG: phage tail tape measure protein [Dehalococcoidia bacterium]|nr:phage tail tape measure protein [Dehalococcoidia bacterium]PWB44981.1 MAG: phage tail tape measure protein [Dehalococcoidia bacterium]